MTGQEARFNFHPSELQGNVSATITGASGRAVLEKLSRAVGEIPNRKRYVEVGPGDEDWFTLLGSDNFKSHVHMLADHRDELRDLRPSKFIVDFGPLNAPEKYAWILTLLDRP